jgi:hypothetical protein
MRKLFLAALALAATVADATTIQWTKTNDAGALSDIMNTDGLYTGKIDLVTFNDGVADDETDALIGKYVVIDVNPDKFYISTSKLPANVVSTALFTGSFGFDLTAATLGTASGYTLTDLAFNNTVSSAALAEFSSAITENPTALYTFSLQQGYGNGQVSGAVPEPATMGLFGLGLMALAFGVRRRKR